MKVENNYKVKDPATVLQYLPLTTVTFINIYSKLGY